MMWLYFSFVTLFLSEKIGILNAKGCVDKKPYCDSWKQSGYCAITHQYFNYMLENCPKTCDLCLPPTTTSPPPPPGCFDKSGYCSSYKSYCNDPGYKSYLTTECKLTCNFCHITTSPPPTTQTTQPYTGSGGRALQPGCGHKGPGHTRIVGGTNAKPGDWPWQVNIDYEKNSGNPGHWCGGTLINEEWVLSAAHCFVDNKKERYWLKLGEHNIKQRSSYEQIFNISQLVLHPKYNSNNYDYDLALLRLDRKAALSSRVRTACLPDHNTVFEDGTECFISGWGLLSDYGVGPAILQQAKVPLVGKQKCEQAYQLIGHSITSQMLCAGFSNGTIDSCQGDSGGPLICKRKSQSGSDIWYLWGAISWGVGCAQKGIYGVYSNPLTMRQWIDSVAFN